MPPILNIEQLEFELSKPTLGVIDAIRAVQGDIIVLGAGGKMGPTLSRMIRRAMDETGHSSRRVIAVSRFSSLMAETHLQQHGVETISCDLLDREAVQRLPDSANVIFMA